MPAAEPPVEPDRDAAGAPEAPAAAPGPPSERIHQRWAPLIVLVGTFGVQGLTLVTGVLTARLLGVEGRGQIALVYAVGLFASQLTLGGSLPNAIAKCLAERGIGARDGLRPVVRRRWWTVAVPMAGAAAVMAFALGGSLDGTGAALVVAGAVMALQTIVFRLFVGSLQGEVGHLPQMVLAAIAPQVLYASTLLGGLLIGWDWNTVGVLCAYFVTSAIGLGYAWTALARPTRDPDAALDERELWHETRRSYVSSIGPIDGLGLDRFFVGLWLSIRDLGFYAAATAVANLCSIIGSAVSTIVLPRVAMLHDDPREQRAVVRRWLWTAAAMIAGVTALLQLLVDPIITIAFGQEFAGAIETARWLLVADALLGFRRVQIAVLQARSAGGRASWIEIALTPVLVAGVALATAQDSLTGVGITMTVAGLLSVVLLGRAVHATTPGVDAARPGVAGPVV